MSRRIEPEVIICYHVPFPELEGNIVHVDYDLSSWKHDEDDVGKSYEAEHSEGIRIVKHTGYVVFEKGGGSAFGGEWRPSKAEDERFLGKPGEIITTIKENGEKFSTKIGEDGKGAMERHWTDHNQPWAHSETHDHYIIWNPDRGTPSLGHSINYWDGIIPEFKLFEVKKAVGRTIDLRQYPDDVLNFKTISEFKWSLLDGGEIQFDWSGKGYGVFRLKQTPDSDDMFYIGEDYKKETGTWYTTVDKTLDHLIDGVKLREIITQAHVTSRNI